MRYRIGQRRYLATFEAHNGNIDETGNPTYDTLADWLESLAGWYCELIATGGSEQIRGRQIAAETTHVIFGDYAAVAAAGITTQHRCTVGGLTRAGIERIYDADGLRTEMVLELKQEHPQP